MKAFFTKAWAWILAHKVISIAVAAVVVIGATLGIVLPSALHDHDFATEWSSDAESHWHAATCKHEEEVADKAAHTYADACDTTCDVCGYTRTVGAHVYDNACDAACNVCGATRTPAAHAYDNACDTACNVCGAPRAITHAHGTTLTAGETTHYYACSVCGDKKDEAAHAFTQTAATTAYLKAAATPTTKAQYWKSCACGAASTTEYFETDKRPVNLAVADASKTYDGQPIVEPELTFVDEAGVGGEFFAYYQGTTLLPGRPTNAGTYKVVVTIEESETHVGETVEREFTIAKKTLNYLNLTKVYDGKAGYNDSVFFLDTTHGLVAGDVVSIETNDDVDYNVGTYTLTDTSGSWDLDDGIYLEGADAANYAFDYQANGAVATITVTPKPLKLLDIEVTYDGGNIPGRFDLTAADGVIAGDDVYLLGDAWQSYDVAYDEYTLTDDFGSDDYDEGVARRERCVTQKFCPKCEETRLRILIYI